jgi:predicted SAM-dependent methyltransferase
MLRAEPFILGALSPILKGNRGRYQRSIMAQKYLVGSGAEIGAFEQPTLVPRGAATKYIDRVPSSHWRNQSEYANLALVEPDILDDGATLSTVADRSFDYLVAAHVLEHIDNPISALKNWTRVVKKGGHLLIVVPDMRFTFDSEREVTTVEHLIRDHEEGPATSANEHYREIATKCDGLVEQSEIEAFVEKCQPAVHFHTFTLESFVEFLLAANRYLGNRFELIEAQLNIYEDIAVLKVL